MPSHVYKNAVWIVDEETTMKTTQEVTLWKQRHNVIGINIQLIVYYADNIVWTYSFFGKKNGIFRISIFLVDFIEKMLRIE